ncbi:MAG: hypothetical protein ACK4K9_05685 [Bacteroidia bacterium]
MHTIKVVHVAVSDSVKKLQNFNLYFDLFLNLFKSNKTIKEIMVLYKNIKVNV